MSEEKIVGNWQSAVKTFKKVLGENGSQWVVGSYCNEHGLKRFYGNCQSIFLQS